MRTILLSAALVTLVTGSAFAATANDNAPSNPAVKTSDGNNPGAPAAGANSFTQGEAKSRIEKRGYSNVTALQKDKDGLWHAKAMKDGKSTEVALDYQGNVVSN
jgi:hypothetical protein